MSFLRKRVEDNKMRHSEVRMFILKYFARSTRSARRNYERFYKSQICIQTVSPAANAVHQAGSSLRYDMLNAKMFRTEYTECTEKLWYTSPQPSPSPFFIFHSSLFTFHSLKAGSSSGTSYSVCFLPKTDTLTYRFGLSLKSCNNKSRFLEVRARLS